MPPPPPAAHATVNTDNDQSDSSIDDDDDDDDDDTSVAVAADANAKWRGDLPDNPKREVVETRVSVSGRQSATTATATTTTTTTATAPPVKRPPVYRSRAAKTDAEIEEWEVPGTTLHVRHLETRAPRSVHIGGLGGDADEFWRRHFGGEYTKIAELQFMNYVSLHISVSHARPLWKLSDAGEDATRALFSSCAYRFQPSCDVDGYVHMSSVGARGTPFNASNACIMGVFLEEAASTCNFPLGVSVGYSSCDEAVKAESRANTVPDERFAIVSLKSPNYYRNAGRDDAPTEHLRFERRCVVMEPDVKHTPNINDDKNSKAAAEYNPSALAEFKGVWECTEKTTVSTAHEFTTVLQPKCQISRAHDPTLITNPDASYFVKNAASDKELTIDSIRAAAIKMFPDDIKPIVSAESDTQSRQPIVEEYGGASDARVILPVCANLPSYRVRPQSTTAELYDAPVKTSYTVHVMNAGELVAMCERFYTFMNNTEDGGALQRAIGPDHAKFYATPKWLNKAAGVRNPTTDEIAVLNAVRFMIPLTNKAMRYVQPKFIVGRIKTTSDSSANDDIECAVIKFSTYMALCGEVSKGHAAAFRSRDTREVSRFAVHVQPAHRTHYHHKFSATLRLGLLVAPRSLNGPSATSSASKSRVHAPLTGAFVSAKQVAAFIHN